MIKQIDPRRAALIFKAELLIPYLVDLFYDDLNKAIKSKGAFHVALAGGSTPKILYQAISSDPRASTTDWKHVYIYYGDERAVAFDHPDSNYKMSLDAGFKNLHGIHFFPMEAYLNDHASCESYQKLLPDHLDFIFLGMGDDGHTASLFPNDPMCHETKKSVALGFVASKNATRMTLTFPYINKSSRIIVLVTGANKQHMIKEVLSENGSKYPVHHIGTSSHPALFVLDESAAALL